MNSEYELLMDRFGTINKPKEGMDVDTAAKKAYADMSRRATGHTPDVQKECLNELKKILDEMPAFKEKGKFDKWHRESCEKLRDAMQRSGFKGTYGRAQKVINMAFKYLMYTDTQHADAHDFCHMTLDRYTLAWYKREVNKKAKTIEWSKIDNYEEYMNIQDRIRDYIKEHTSYSIDITGQGEAKTVCLPEQPFLAEFVIWEGEKLFEKYSGLVSGISAYITSGKKDDSWLIGNIFSDYLETVIK